MNKKQIRAARLDRHYAALERLATACGCKKINGKRISCALLRIEQDARRWFTWQCNGYTCSGDASWQEQERHRFQPTDEEIDAKHVEIRKAVAKVLGDLPPQFYLNTDPRGCALKLEAGGTCIKAGCFTTAAPDFGLERDMGGYQLLAPTITGD